MLQPASFLSRPNWVLRNDFWDLRMYILLKKRAWASDRIDGMTDMVVRLWSTNVP